MAADDDRYRTFLALSGNGIARFVLDQPLDVTLPEEQQVEHIVRHGRIAECNHAFADLYALGVGELTGRTIPDFVPVGEPARLEGIRQFVRSGYRLVDGEEVHTEKDGSSRHVSGSALGVVEAGKLLSYWLTLADITERKRAAADRERRGQVLEAVAFGAARLLEPGSWEEHTEEFLARLGRAADVSRLLLVKNETDPDGVLRGAPRSEWAAPGLERLADVPRFERGVRWQDVGLGHWEKEIRRGLPLVGVVSRLPEAEQAPLKILGVLSFASVPVLAGGEWWGLLSFQELRFEREWSGPELEALKAAAAVFGAAIERERADAALRESEERFERLSAAAFEGIAITEAGVFIDANEQLARMLGCSVTDLIGREVLGFVAAADRERVRSSLKTATEEPYEHAARRHDGSVFPVEVRGRALPHRGRTVRVSAIRDVSARVEAERQLRRARTMEAMGSLVAGVAHEVRNPLFSISASVDALDSELGARPEIAEYAALLRSQVQRLGQLMRDLLDYGKPSVLRRGPTRLADVVRRASRSCASLGRERHVRVEEDLAADLPPLDIDAVRVEQALENLLANAIQHAPAGSVVRVAGRLDQTGLEPMARCTVEDEGPGVPVQSLEQVFEPFFSRRKGGTGLGLAIVQRVAEAHGGDVLAENRPGTGARFTLLLPVGRTAVRAEGARDA